MGDGAFNNSEIYYLCDLNSLEELEIGNDCYKSVKTEIGNDCYKSVKTFKIDGLNRLKTIKIGINSFTEEVHYYIWNVGKEDNIVYDNGYNPSKSLHILNCESLESIQIGEYSFSDFAGEFELKNLPQLQSIQIGTIGSNSRNFYNSSFVIRGIELILNIE